MSSLDALETSSPVLLQSVQAHRGEVTCADACGGRLVTGGGDRVLALWRWQPAHGWTEAGTAKQAHRYGVTAARWSPGGALIASGGVDGCLRVWCGRSLTPRRLLAAPGAPAVRSLCWPGPARLLAGHDDGAVYVWHVPRGLLIASVHAHRGAVHALAAPAKGALLFAACTEGVLKVFDLQEVCRNAEEGLPSPAPVSWVDSAHDMGVLCADARADGAAAATGGHDARVRVWWVDKQGRERSIVAGAVLCGHGAAVTAVRWGRTRLGSAALDRTARLWDPEGDGACLCVLMAHTRYLTCLALAPDHRYMITGSNDKSVRMWSLGALTIDGELEPPCTPHAHFGVGDLEGIGPVDSEDLVDLEANIPGIADEEASGEGSRIAWRASDAHEGAVNCIDAFGDLLATASSDGTVRIFRWNEADGRLEAEHTMESRGYPVLAADFGAGGAMLLSGGLDATAQLWDVESGCLLRSLAPPSASETESGGGGVRGARVSPHRPPLLLLATDDGVAPLWSLADPDPRPIHVYTGHAEAAVCCAWSPDGRLAATGGAAGELRVHQAPPNPCTIISQPDAHDLGVQSCDFSPGGAAGLTSPRGAEGAYLLATGGCDSYIRLWLIELNEDVSGPQATMQLVKQLSAHGGGVSSVRWGRSPGGGVLCSGGADRWARVWHVAGAGAEGTIGMKAAGAVPVAAAGGATAVALVDGGLLAVGSLSGELALWQVSALQGEAEAEGGAEDEAEEDAAAEAEGDSDVGAAPRWWGAAGVARWLREYVTRVPGSTISREEENHLLQRVRDAHVTGTQLMDEPIDQLLQHLGYGDTTEDTEELEQNNERRAIRDRLMDELKWLRRDSPPPELAWWWPHALLCPLSHGVLGEAARAADGCTYHRPALHEWFLAADGAVSGVSGRRLRNARAHPNYRARDALRALLLQHDHDTNAQ